MKAMVKNRLMNVWYKINARNRIRYKMHNPELNKCEKIDSM